MCDSLIEESPNRHALRSRLCRELAWRSLVEPQQSMVPHFHDRYNSAMLTGDVESAMICLLTYCTASFYSGTNLASLSKTFRSCIKQSVRLFDDSGFFLVFFFEYHTQIFFAGLYRQSISNSMHFTRLCQISAFAFI